jgi:Chloroplast import apparatus Tic20-like
MATRGRGRRANNRLLLLLLLLSLNSQVWAFIGRQTPLRNNPSLGNDSTRYARAAIPAVSTSGASERRVRVDAKVSKSPSSSLTTLSMWKWDDELKGRDRIKACIPYILPLLDGDQFGNYIYERISLLGCVNAWTLGPLVDLFHKVPFLSITLFCALTLGTRFNFEGMDRNVRFNAQQAALLDVVLLLPEFIGSAFMDDPLPRWIVEPCNNLVYYACITTVGYCIYSNLRGKKPDQLPYISSGAELMTGPF